MAAKSPEAIARSRITEAVKVLREGLHDRQFDLSYHEVLANAERSLDWLNDMKFMKSSYIKLAPTDIDPLLEEAHHGLAA